MNGYHATSPTDGSDRLAPNETLCVLADARRRRLLRYLFRCRGPAHVDQIAAHLADRRSSGDTAERHRIELHHVHLPKLADLGLIDYDPGAKVADVPETRGRGVVERLFRSPE